MKPIVALTVGDYNGIGPEVVLHSAQDERVRRACIPLLIGPVAAFDYYARRYGLPRAFIPLGPFAGAAPAFEGTRALPVVEPEGLASATVRPGTISRAAGRAAGASVEAATRLALAGIVQAVVTSPLSKKSLHLAGFHWPGQTEMLGALCRTREVAMMLVSPSLRIGLVTIHEPISRVARRLTRSLLLERIRVIRDALRTDWRIARPRLALLALNPHGGEGGDIGHEERTVMRPVLRRLRRQGYRIEGPFPADAFFARYRAGTADAVIAAYHDQGLIPLKILARNRGVNVTVGLPIIRTSPDHGTGFDIAGRGAADPASMIEAILLAVRLHRNRRLIRQKAER